MVIATGPVTPVNRVVDYFSDDYKSDQADFVMSYVESGLPRHHHHGPGFNGTGSSVQKTSFRLDDIFSGLIPKDNAGKIAEGKRIRSDVSIIMSLINFKLSLYTKNFSISKSKRGASKFVKLAKKWKLKSIQKELHDDLLTSDNAILVWKTASANSTDIEFVMRVSPDQAKVTVVNQIEFLSIKLDKKLFEQYEQILREFEASRRNHDPLLIEEIKRLPEEWFKFAKEDKLLPLSKKDGYHFSIKRKYADREDNGLCRPSIISIFTDALILRYLELAEFTTAYNLKNLILHVRHGETITEAGIVNKDFRTSKPKLNALRLKLNNLEKGLKFFTDHTVQLDYVFPPLELFKKDRYESVLFRVINIWGGMANALFAGDTKTSVGSSFIAMKRPQIEGDANRDIIIEILKEFLAFAGGVEEDKVPGINYDNDALRDDKLKLDIMKFMKQWGLIHSEGVQREFGHDPDEILAGQKKDLKNKEHTIPPFEPSQNIVATKVWGIKKGGGGSSNANEAGRPTGGQDGAISEEGVTGEQDRSSR